MVRLEKDVAVIGAINELLLQNMEPLINFDIICKYSRMMEARSGYVVVNVFSEETLERFLSSNKEIFQYDFAESMSRGKQSYRLRIDTGRCDLERQHIIGLVQKMLDVLDPCLNYPMRFLEDMQLMDALSS